MTADALVAAKRRDGRPGLLADARLARQLLRGSDRREWWRISLTVLGALLATGFALAAVTTAALEGSYRNAAYGNGLLDSEGTRRGVIAALLGLLVPVLGFLGQCARIGAVHRDRRLAALRLAGATPRQVRRIAALEVGVSGLLGSLAGFAGFGLLLAVAGHAPAPLTWGFLVLVTLALPALAAVVSAFALRHVVASPLGWVRRVRPEGGRTRPFVSAGILAVLGGGIAALLAEGRGGLSDALVPIGAVAVVGLVGLGAVTLSGACAKALGHRFARSSRPAVVIAAGRLRADPWAAARTHAAVLLVTVVGVGFLGIWQLLTEHLKVMEGHTLPAEYYHGGFRLVGLGLLVALAISLSALAVGTAESLATQRRALAAQVAAGVPRAVLRRAVLLETALPLAPALLLASGGGAVLYGGYRWIGMAGWPFPLLPLLAPVGVYVVCLLATATALPLLGRAVRPGQLRYA
ncbi:FtsX-like permease family protein [Streptomyces sp. NPDC002851]